MQCEWMQVECKCKASAMQVVVFVLEAAIPFMQEIREIIGDPNRKTP